MRLCQNAQSGVKDLKKGRVGMKKWGYCNLGYSAFGLNNNTRVLALFITGGLECEQVQCGAETA